MVNSFQCLRHHAVIGGYNEHCDIGNLRTTSAHGGKGFVSRCIQECNFLSVEVHLISPDVLGNTAGFTIHDITLPDSIQ